MYVNVTCRQLASALPLGANVYGLGEVVASSGIRRDVGTDGGVGTIQNDWGPLCFFY